MHARKIVGGITLATMYYYDGLSGRRKVYIVGYVVHEHATIFDCQARAVDICCWEFRKRGSVASDVEIHVVWSWGCLCELRWNADDKEGDSE